MLPTSLLQDLHQHPSPQKTKDHRTELPQTHHSDLCGNEDIWLTHSWTSCSSPSIDYSVIRSPLHPPAGTYARFLFVDFSSAFNTVTSSPSWVFLTPHLQVDHWLPVWQEALCETGETCLWLLDNQPLPHKSVSFSPSALLPLHQQLHLQSSLRLAPEVRKQHHPGATPPLTDSTCKVCNSNMNALHYAHLVWIKSFWIITILLFKHSYTAYCELLNIPWWILCTFLHKTFIEITVI